MICGANGIIAAFLHQLGSQVQVPKLIYYLRSRVVRHLITSVRLFHSSKSGTIIKFKLRNIWNISDTLLNPR